MNKYLCYLLLVIDQLKLFFRVSHFLLFINFHNSTKTYLFFFFFNGSGAHQNLPSSPTRPSSDPITAGVDLVDLIRDVVLPEGTDVLAVRGLSLHAAQDPDRVRPDVAAVLGDEGQEDARTPPGIRSEEHTAEIQSQSNILCRLLLVKKKHIDTVP